MYSEIVKTPSKEVTLLGSQFQQPTADQSKFILWQKPMNGQTNFAESLGGLCGGGAHCHCHYTVVASVIQDRDRYWYCYCYYYRPCYRDRYCYCVCFYCYLFWCSVRRFFRSSSIKLDHKLFCVERNSLKPQYVVVLAISVNYFNICELLTHPIPRKNKRLKSSKGVSRTRKRVLSSETSGNRTAC